MCIFTLFNLRGVKELVANVRFRYFEIRTQPNVPRKNRKRKSRKLTQPVMDEANMLTFWVSLTLEFNGRGTKNGFFNFGLKLLEKI